jgi:5-methylcytosine-specific restriction endonuclease McrA
LAVDHILPQSLGGLTTLENLALACLSCNQHKSNRTSFTDPLTKTVAPLFHPRTEIWNNHFAWSNDFTLIAGLTPTGRATVAALHLNRPGLVNLRHILHAFGLHPPA